jgi:uncharacterized membrane protein YcaP (DUF421 family)
MSWDTIFLPSAPLAELLIRGTVMYLAIFVLMRLVGRRESGELNTSDLILVLLLAEAANSGLAGETRSIFDSLIVIVTILAWSLLLDAAGYRWEWAAKLLKPAPKPLIANGVLNQHTARRELLTRSEIASELRKQGIDDISDVFRAYVEPTGTISILERP